MNRGGPLDYQNNGTRGGITHTRSLELARSPQPSGFVATSFWDRENRCLLIAPRVRLVPDPGRESVSGRPNVMQLSGLSG